MIAKIKTRIRGSDSIGIFHDSRSGVAALAKVCNEIIDKLNEVIEKQNETHEKDALDNFRKFTGM